MKNQTHNNPDGVRVSGEMGALEHLASARDQFARAIVGFHQARARNPQLAARIDAELASVHDAWKVLDRDVKLIARDHEITRQRGVRLLARVEALSRIVDEVR